MTSTRMVSGAVATNQSVQSTMYYSETHKNWSRKNSYIVYHFVWVYVGLLKNVHEFWCKKSHEYRKPVIKTHGSTSWTPYRFFKGILGLRTCLQTPIKRYKWVIFWGLRRIFWNPPYPLTIWTLAPQPCMLQSPSGHSLRTSSSVTNLQEIFHTLTM